MSRMGETVLNIILMIIGLAMISVSVFCNAPDDSITKKIIEVIGDLGIGVFPTGAIGLLLNRMQNKEEKRQKTAQRNEVLRRIDTSLHQYLVTVCKEAMSHEIDVKDKPITQIINNLNQANLLRTSAESERLKVLIERIEEYFDKPNPVFIMTDCFTEQEQRFHTQQVISGKNLISCDDDDVQTNRASFLNSWSSGWIDIPEYQYYKDQIFDGDNLVSK